MEGRQDIRPPHRKPEVDAHFLTFLHQAFCLRSLANTSDNNMML